MHYFVDRSEQAVRTPAPGAEGRIVHGEALSVALWTFEADTGLPAHSHPHEQIALVVEGEIELTVDGETRLLSPGMSAVIPGGVEHSAHTRTFCRVVDAFHPVREDLR